mmetsp:Transcript_33714/g.32742  ORF Transcript_33714/g.32742 Transcript_33714/m.32742 type:complete len:146 (-) Transcript_33714:164-601(-)
MMSERFDPNIASLNKRRFVENNLNIFKAKHQRKTTKGAKFVNQEIQFNLTPQEEDFNTLKKAYQDSNDQDLKQSESEEELEKIEKNLMGAIVYSQDKKRLREGVQEEEMLHLMPTHKARKLNNVEERGSEVIQKEPRKVIQNEYD